MTFKGHRHSNESRRKMSESQMKFSKLTRRMFRLKSWKTRRMEYGITGRSDGVPLQKLSIEDKIWIACALDTEGCFSKQNNYKIIVIEMTSKKFISKFSRLVGQKIYHKKNPLTRDTHSRRLDSYRVVISGLKAEALHRQIKEYLLIKRFPD